MNLALVPMKDLPSKVAALDDILECPVCYDHLSGSILQCTQGHHVCQKCVLRVDKCPLCESKFNGTRNYLAESIITKFDEIKNALKSLNIYNLLCTEVKKPPATVIKLEKFPCGMDYCPTITSYNGMILHVNQVHEEHFFDEGVEESYNYFDWWSIGHEPGTTWEKIIYIKNMGIFFLKIYISNKGNVYGYVLNVKAISSLTFYYVLYIDNPDSYNLSFDGPVESTAVSHKKGKYLDIEDALCEDSDGDLYFDVSLKINRTY